jgi:hypothetical protein
VTIEGEQASVATAAAPRMLSRTEVAAFADAIGALLADPDAGLSPDARRRWEGALTAAEVILRREPSLVAGVFAADVRRLL